MLHLFSPHYSMGLNITNEMNICTFFHGVFGVSRVPFFYCIKNVCMYCVYSTLNIVCLSLFNAHKTMYARTLVWCVRVCVCAWGRAFERDCCCSIVYTTCTSMAIRCCQCVRSANSIFFQSQHIFFRGFVTYVVVTICTDLYGCT